LERFIKEVKIGFFMSIRYKLFGIPITPEEKIKDAVKKGKTCKVGSGLWNKHDKNGYRVVQGVVHVYVSYSILAQEVIGQALEPPKAYDSPWQERAIRELGERVETRARELTNFVSQVS